LVDKREKTFIPGFAVLTLLRVSLAIAGVPVVALLALIMRGDAAPGPALGACALVVTTSVILALIWTNDLRALAELLHRVSLASNGPIALPGAGPMSLSPQILGEVAQLSTMLGERNAMVDQLLRAEESIVERLPDPLVVLGADRSVRRANAAARAAFGGDIQAVLRHPDLRAAIERAIAGGPTAPPQTAQLRVPVPVPREIQATVVGLDSPLSGGGGVLAVLSDRTREKVVERTRADFVANASHELRTPLASLIGFISTLRGPAADDPPAQKRFLEIMAEQAERMNRLIDDLLSLSRVEITEHQAPNEKVDMEELIERLLAGFEIAFRQRGTTLDWKTFPNMPWVIGDTDQLEQVAQNLLDNALKYGKQGGTIRVRLEPPVPGGPFPARAGVVFSVADDGPGIPKQHLPRLTERFYRVDTGRSRAIGGTGLGLAIVKHIVNRHRGALHIESEPGQGAKFSVWLPAA
jgi:two-component system phosphate regulon sensor histidine kinase PhoR